MTMITLCSIMYIYYIWITTALWVQCKVLSFVPPTSTNVHQTGRLKLSLFPKWTKGTTNEGSEDDKPPTDVYASRLTTSAKDDSTLSKDAIDVMSVTEPPPAVQPISFAEKTDYDVIVVGAGCAGVGTALMLTKTFGLDTSKVLCIEQGTTVGTSFRQWPEEMKFISPSFDQQEWTKSFDLNSIYWGTSPADFLRSEHPSGYEYALYLEALAKQGDLQIQFETKVMSISDVGGTKDVPGPFNVEIKKMSDSSSADQPSSNKETATISARYIVWAAGEFQYPRDKRTIEYVFKEGGDENTNGKSLPTKRFNSMFQGAEYCLHNSRVPSWANLPGNDFIIIGGYESGVDAAYNLAKAGKRCKVLASTPTWCLKTGDPSSELAPYTAARLREVLSPRFSPRPELLAPLRVIAVDKAKEGGGFNIAAKWKAIDDNLNSKGLGFQVDDPGEKDSIILLQTKHPPVLCTGFEGSVAVAPAMNLFDFPDPANRKKGCIGNGPLLTRNDESTKVPGVFLVGPSVTHGKLSFCFVYKFRQRFAVVANAICQGLGRETQEIVAECRAVDMYLDNFATCEGMCDDNVC